MNTYFGQTLVLTVLVVGFFLSSGTVHAADAQCSGTDLVTPALNPTLFASGTAGNGASFACWSQDNNGGGSYFYYNSDWTPYGKAISTVSDSGTVTQADKNGKEIAQPTSCSGFLNSMANPWTCLARSLANWLATILIYLSSWVLVLAGVIFNWLVIHTIVEFANFYQMIQPGVEKGWSAFRDIANILIIGIFTFIAVSIILGLKEYGQKKFVARVLIIAVLINFSLLFAKIITDASNFTATQIYNAAGLGSDSLGNAASTGTTADTSQVAAGAAGISGQLIQLLGVQSFGNTKTALDKIAEASDTIWLAPLHGIFVMAILLGAALMLFYGSFLLISRAVMLIFLFVTASVSFASYLVPKWEKSHYGWDAWWSSLLWCTALAPMLMLSLWITITVGSAVHAQAGSGSFGDMIANPSSPANVGILFNYLLILGLLYASFKISSMSAGKIGGFSFASALAASPLTLGSRFLAAPLLRGLVGGAANRLKGPLASGSLFDMSRSESASRQAAAFRAAGNLTAAAQAQREADKLRRSSDRKSRAAGLAGGLADSKFNLMDTQAMQAAAKAAGVTGFAAGKSSKDEKSYADQVKAAAETAEKRTPAVSDEQKKAMRAQALGETKERRRVEKEQKQQSKESAQQIKDAVQQMAEQQKEGFKQQKDVADRQLEAAKREQAQNKTAHENEIRAIQGSNRTESEKVLQRQEAEARRASQMRGEADNIARAESRVKELQGEMKKIDEEHEFDDGKGGKTTLAKATENLGKIETDLREYTDDKTNDRRTNEIADALTNARAIETRQNVAAGIARREAGLFGRYTSSGNDFAKAARNKIKSSSDKSKLVKLFEEVEHKANEKGTGSTSAEGGAGGGGH